MINIFFGDKKMEIVLTVILVSALLIVGGFMLKDSFVKRKLEQSQEPVSPPTSLNFPNEDKELLVEYEKRRVPTEPVTGVDVPHEDNDLLVEYEERLVPTKNTTKAKKKPVSKKKPLKEGSTRGNVKGGASKPTSTQNTRPNQPPPAPTKKKPTSKKKPRKKKPNISIAD